MSSTPHPTIEGVTVEFTPNPYGSYRFDVRVLTLASDSTPTTYIRAWNNPGWGRVINASELSIKDDQAETVIEMIRDQAAWLAAQGATT